jgi:hypothetical protein
MKYSGNYTYHLPKYQLCMLRKLYEPHVSLGNMGIVFILKALTIRNSKLRKIIILCEVRTEYKLHVNNCPTRCNNIQFFIFVNCSTCFEW